MADSQIADTSELKRTRPLVPNTFTDDKQKRIIECNGSHDDIESNDNTEYCREESDEVKNFNDVEVDDLENKKAIKIKSSITRSSMTNLKKAVFTVQPGILQNILTEGKAYRFLKLFLPINIFLNFFIL